MKGENGCFLLSIPKLLLMKTNFYLVAKPSSKCRAKTQKSTMQAYYF